MALFITTPKRVLKINDAYIMALSFLIFFAVGRIFKAVIKSVIEKQKKNNPKNVDIPNPRGGNFGFDLTDDSELAHTILTCIADNERYLVKDPELTKIIFALVKVKVENQSVILTPNLIRFLALKLINNDQTFMVQVGNFVASSNNRFRLLSRTFGSAIFGFMAALITTLPYGILMLLLYFDATENCNYNCSNHFEQLPIEGPAKIYGEKSTGHLFIGGNDDARQIEIYTPSKAADEVTVSSDGESKRTKTYTKVRKKVKEVKFSDFKKIDPVLSSFQDLQEPEVPQRVCPVNDIHDIIDVQVE